jgi:hypothetical protein
MKTMLLLGDNTPDQFMAGRAIGLQTQFTTTIYGFFPRFPGKWN